MKFLQSSIFRALCAIIVGALVVYYRADALKGITIAIGVLFFISGVISLATYYSAVRHKSDVDVYDAEGNLIVSAKPSFPIVGIGSLVLGAILALMPSTFMTWLMYVLAAILVLGAISQYVMLAGAARIGHVGWFFWLMPSVILIIAIFAIVKPMETAEAPLFIIGWCMMLYGVVECMNAMKIQNERRKFLKAQEDAKKAAEAEAQAAAGETGEAPAADADTATPSTDNDDEDFPDFAE